jgi:hypothetical protein
MVKKAARATPNSLVVTAQGKLAWAARLKERREVCDVYA